MEVLGGGLGGGDSISPELSQPEQAGNEFWGWEGAKEQSRINGRVLK